MTISPPINEARRLVFLFVDDPEVAANHQALLESFGYDVRLSRDPGGVSGGPLKFKPLALIVGNREPENVQRSLDAMKRLKSEGRLTCPVIFIGSHEDVRLRLAAVRSGASAFLEHPVNPMKLVDAVDRFAQLHDEAPFRVLVLDDSLTHARYFASILETEGMETRVVTDPLRIAAELRSFQPEMLITDINMPDCTGYEISAVVRQEQNYDGLPIVYLSGEMDAEKRLDALESGGADDFIAKNSVPEHLIRSVKIKARRFRELRAHIECDSLTGLLKHTAAKTALAQDVARNDVVAVAFLDIDHFKSVNDNFGHATGDLVIKALARLLKHKIRRRGVIGRMGGEEFMAVMPGLSAELAFPLFEGLREEFAHLVHTGGNVCLKVTLSCGLADTQGRTPSEACGDADEALYKAKNAGRNRVVIAGRIAPSA